MLTVLEKCFADRFEGWKPALEAMIPSLGEPLAADPKRAKEVMGETAEALGIVV